MKSSSASAHTTLRNVAGRPSTTFRGYTIFPTEKKASNWRLLFLPSINCPAKLRAGGRESSAPAAKIISASVQAHTMCA